MTTRRNPNAVPLPNTDLAFKQLAIYPSDYRPDDPWASDCAPARKRLAETLERCIRASSGPYVIAIHATWGAGKTLFLHMWRDDLKDVCPIYFNAWENDYLNDPFLAFMNALESHTDDRSPPATATTRSENMTVSKSSESLRGATRAVLKKGLTLIERFKYFTVPLTGFMACGNPADTGVVMALATAIVNLFRRKNPKSSPEKRLADAQQARAEFIGSFAQLGATALEQTGVPLVVMVDELDRCKPTFAIALLEQIKHLFSVPGVVFVLAIDKPRLCAYIENLYGLPKNDGTDYLRKFIDFDVDLPPLDLPAFFQKTLEGSTVHIALPEKQQTFCVGRNMPYPPGIERKASLSLVFWLTAVVEKRLTTARSAATLAMRISFLSALNGMDFLSLLVCADALARLFRDEADSTEAALEAIFALSDKDPDLAETAKLQPKHDAEPQRPVALPTQLRLSYKSLIDARKDEVDNHPPAKDKPRSPQESRFYAPLRRQLCGDIFVNLLNRNLANAEELEDPFEEHPKWIQWRWPLQGQAWKDYLLDCLYFTTATIAADRGASSTEPG